MTTLRNVIGGMTLEETLTSRETINDQLRGNLDEATGKWGIRIHRVELKSVDPPPSIKDTMEKQMRADREKRAAVLQAEGIKQAAILTAEGEKQSAILKAEGQRQAAILAAEGQAEGDRDRLQGNSRRKPRPAAPRLRVSPGSAPDRPGRREQGLGDPERADEGARRHFRPPAPPGEGRLGYNVGAQLPMTR